MHPFLAYNLKAGVCLALFYLFYKLLLSRETFHRFNRIVLLFSSLLAFALPLCVITIEREAPSRPPTVLVLSADAASLTTDTPAMAAPTVPSAEPFHWAQFVWWLFLAGAGGTLAWTLLSVGRIVRLIRRGHRIPLADGRQLVLTQDECTPFSWMRFIVLSERDYAESGPEILIHEQAHIRLRHSCDLLMTDLAGCLQWFNPAMWLLRQELRAVHEYEADEAVLSSGTDAKRYQTLLVKKAAGHRWYSVANSFNHSKLKNRITMMLQKRSSRWAGVKALYVLLLSGAALGAFAETRYVFVEDGSTQFSQSLQSANHDGTDSLATACRTMSCTTTVSDGDKEVKGIVTCDGKPVGGAVVRIIGSDRSFTTDSKGQFRIDASEGPMQLEISAPAYGQMRMTMQVQGGERIAASLKSDRQMELEKHLDPEKPIILVDGLIVDQSLGEIVPSEIASMSILQDTSLVVRYGEPARNGVVSIATVNASEKQPLYIIDGKPAAGSDLPLIDPADIASMSVIKDDSTLQEYGEQARNGVILITTKQFPKTKGKVVSVIQTTTTTDDREGAAVSVTVRSDGTQPVLDKKQALIVVDGEIYTGELSSIDPDQIATMTVLKDKSTVEQYGEQAKEGVIVISTRNPKKGLRYVGTEPLIFDSSLNKYIVGRGRFTIAASECNPLVEVDGRIVGNGYLRRMDAERVLLVSEFGGGELAAYGPAAAGHDRLVRITTLDHGSTLYDDLLRYGQEMLRRSELSLSQNGSAGNMSGARRDLRSAADLLEKAHKLRPGDRRTLELLVEAATKAGEGSERIDRTYAKLATKYRRMLER